MGLYMVHTVQGVYALITDDDIVNIMMRKRKSTASTGIQEHQTSFLGGMANTYCRLCRNDSLIIVGNQVQDIAQVNAVGYFTTLCRMCQLSHVICWRYIWCLTLEDIKTAG